jgi:8-oxo-dGTP diphosphatase
MIKPSEYAELATINEIIMETNIDCVIRNKLGERIHPDTKLKCIYFECQYLGGEIMNLDLNENADVKWVKVNMVRKYITSDLFFGIEDLLKSIKS